MSDPAILRRLAALERTMGRDKIIEKPWGRIAARVYRSTVQSVPTAADTAISFDTERWDTADIWIVGQPTRLTAPVDGYYLVGGTIGFANAGDVTLRQITIRVNGTTTIAGDNRAAINGVVIRLNVHAVWYALAGDYFEFRGRQDSGGNLNTENLSAVATEFWLERIA